MFVVGSSVFLVRIRDFPMLKRLMTRSMSRDESCWDPIERRMLRSPVFGGRLDNNIVDGKNELPRE
jgi:hypothetical protein